MLNPHTTNTPQPLIPRTRRAYGIGKGGGEWVISSDAGDGEPREGEEGWGNYIMAFRKKEE